MSAGPTLRETSERPGQAPRAFLRDFWRLAGPYWSGGAGRAARLLTLAVAVLTVAQVGVPVAINLWSERLFDTLEQRAMSELFWLVGALGVILLSNVLITTGHLWVKRRLQVDWRAWVTQRLTEEWMRAGRHYALTLVPGDHDNPDGRIAEDVRIATEYAVDLAHSLFYCVLLLASFTHILWSLSGPPQLALGSVSVYLPGHLVWVALAYAGLGTSATILLGRPLVRAAGLRQVREASFRLGLAHAREGSLTIAQLHTERAERRRLGDLFRDAACAWEGQTTALCNLFVFSSGWSVLSQAFPILVVAPRYISGSITLGVLMQSAQAFQQMVAALAWPIDNLPKVAEWRASAGRVLGLHRALAELGERARSAGAALDGSEPGSGPGDP